MARVAVEDDAADRCPGLEEDAVLGAERLRLPLREVGRASIWLSAGTTLALVEQRGEVVDQRAVELRRQRLVQDQQIDPVDAQLASAFLEPVQVSSYP